MVLLGNPLDGDVYQGGGHGASKDKGSGSLSESLARGGHIRAAGTFEALQGLNLLEAAHWDRGEADEKGVDAAPLERLGSTHSSRHTHESPRLSGSSRSPKSPHNGADKTELSDVDAANVKEEDRQVGAVALKVWLLYMRLLSTRALLLLVPLYLISQGGDAVSSYVLNLWTQDLQHDELAGRDQSEET